MGLGSYGLCDRVLGGFMENRTEQYKKWRKDGTIYRYILWRREMKGIEKRENMQ